MAQARGARPAAAVCQLFGRPPNPANNQALPSLAPQAASRPPWAKLLRRVSGTGVLTRDRLGGARRIIVFVKQPAIARRILEHLCLPATGPPHAGPRPPPQHEWLDRQQPAFI